MVTPLQQLKNTWLDPDTVYGYGNEDTYEDEVLGNAGAFPFIVWDLDNDGQYEVSEGGAGQVHWRIVESLGVEDLAVLNQSTLPIVMGRTGVWVTGSTAYKVVTFWQSDRVELFTTNTIRKQFNHEDMSLFRSNSFKGDFDQFIAKNILPLLLKEGVIDRSYRWFDSSSRYRGLVSRQSRKPKTKVVKFNMNGREYTYTELMSMLHTGDQQTRAMVTDFLCRSTEPQLKDVQSRLECNKPRPKMWTMPRKVDIGHQPGAVDFRSQKSLNRAWEEEMSRRMSRRARLARRLLVEVPDV